MKEALRLDGEEFRDKPLKVVKSNKSDAAEAAKKSGQKRRFFD